MDYDALRLLFDIERRVGILECRGDEPDTVQTSSKPKKKKVSAYNREYKKQYAILKAKHPRAKFHSLVKKAHAATRRARS